MNTSDELDLRDDDAERALIGAVGFHPDACGPVLASLPAEAFHNPHREAVWRACRRLSAERAPLTPGQVHQALAAEGSATAGTQLVLSSEFASAHPAHHTQAHAERVSTLAARRDLLRRVTRIQQIAREDHYEPSELLARMRESLEGEVATTADNGSGPLRWRQLVDEFQREHDPDTKRRFVDTPWTVVNELLGGLLPSRMYVIGGRPGQGKSNSALALAGHAAQAGHETLVCSREMPSVDVTGRILARGAHVDVGAINARKMSHDARAKVKDWVASVGDIPLTVDAKPRNLSGIKTAARAHKHKYGLDVLVVDYLQLVHTDVPGRNREQEVAQVSMQLKRLAMELDCIVILPAQLNRGSLARADQKPTMADLRDSGQIEQDADVVILLHRPKNDLGEHTGRILFIVDKNRHGPTAELSLGWFGSYGDIA